MEKKSGNNFSQDAMRLAASPAGQRLLAMLQQQNSSQLQTAKDLISSGDYEKAIQTLSGVLNSPEAKALIAQLEDEHG